MIKMDKKILITGTSRGIGNYLAKYYIGLGYKVFGCSRKKVEPFNKNYVHFKLDICNELDVKKMFNKINTEFGGIDILINNAGIASMNHSLLTTIGTVKNIFDTNFTATFLFCREAAKSMQKNKFGRIVNFSTVAVPLSLEGEAIYASSKAAVISLTKILAKEFAPFNVTINAVGPTPIKTDLIKSVPNEKLKNLIDKQAIKRFGKFNDVVNVIDFFIREESDFISGQEIYLGGV